MQYKRISQNPVSVTISLLYPQVLLSDQGKSNFEGLDHTQPDCIA